MRLNKKIVKPVILSNIVFRQSLGAVDATITPILDGTLANS